MTFEILWVAQVFCIFDDFIRKLKLFIVGQFNSEWATVFVKARSRIFNMYFIIRM